MKSLVLLMTTLLGISAQAEIRKETIEYKDGDTVLEGYLAYDSKRAAKRPGVVVVHAWKGIGPFVKQRTEELAKLGYTAFAADIYGKDMRPKDSKEAGAMSSAYKNDRAKMRRRVNLALEELRKHKTVNGAKTAAIGYCFGGTAVLELARSGADTLGVVSFHGGLDTPSPADAKNIKAKVLVLHGADDKHVPLEQVTAFENEMRAAGVDWELVKYSKAVHAFTEPEAGNDPSKGVAYNAEADARSWIAMQNFFREIFR
ncbi:MAG: dienelactone hydrolase family protein [Bdellovibrionales bacterium]|nr:dienelactone hydrolase family protein [Bdellovibrionales bacterium]